MATKVKKFSSYKVKKIKSNLLYFYDQATKDKQLYQDGEAWYLQANIWCETMAVKYGYSTEVVAEVLSALSPTNKWDRNKVDAEAVLSAVRNNEPMGSVKVCTYNKNKEKAFDIARLKTRIVHGSPKTYAFVQNIAHLNPDYVTIDRWHLRASFDRMIVPNNLTPAKYEQLQNITIKLAKEKGLRGYEFQAIVWGAVRGSL